MYTDFMHQCNVNITPFLQSLNNVSKKYFLDILNNYHTSLIYIEPLLIFCDEAKESEPVTSLSSSFIFDSDVGAIQEGVTNAYQQKQILSKQRNCRTQCIKEIRLSTYSNTTTANMREKKDRKKLYQAQANVILFRILFDLSNYMFSCLQHFQNVPVHCQRSVA